MNQYPELVRLAREYLALSRTSGMAPTFANVAAREAAWKTLCARTMGRDTARDLVLFLERMEDHERLMQG
jgi:hypothetical protein